MAEPRAQHNGRAFVARAGTNIALVKYWGKRDPVLNLPATGSLSLTLDGLGTKTRVRFAIEAGGPEREDRVLLAGAPADPAFAARVRRFLDLVRARAGLNLPAEVATTNSVPTAGGLASSASGFAALALAATRAAGLVLSPDELSALARRGSGSAARSIHGGFVEMARGERPDGSDAVARPLLSVDAWDVRLVIALTTSTAKSISSSLAMERTAHSSPYYRAWIASTETDLAQARAAILARDLVRLGPIMEGSALRMHACALAAEPAIFYWNATTVAALEAVWRLRAAGIVVYATIDAGPHVKALCAAPDVPTVQAALRCVDGVVDTLVAAPGGPAQVEPS